MMQNVLGRIASERTSQLDNTFKNLTTSTNISYIYLYADLLEFSLSTTEATNWKATIENYQRVSQHTNIMPY